MSISVRFVDDNGLRKYKRFPVFSRFFWATLAGVGFPKYNRFNLSESGTLFGNIFPKVYFYV